MTQALYEPLSGEEELLERLEERLGRVHARQRLGMEREYEDRFSGRVNFFNPDKWYSAHSFFTRALKLTGLYQLGLKNAGRIEVRHNHIDLPDLPSAFGGFTILHLSDLHVEMSASAM